MEIYFSIALTIDGHENSSIKRVEEGEQGVEWLNILKDWKIRREGGLVVEEFEGSYMVDSFV